MRRFAALLAVLPVIVLLTAGVAASAQTCTGTGLACNQLPVNSCSGTTTTTISGTVYAPNGTDPLPNVLVFIPNAPLPALNTGSVACVTPATPPGGSPLVGTISAADGTFTISNVPVGIPFPLVIQAGRWRAKITVPAISVGSSCTNTPVGGISFPAVQTPGDNDDNIPLIAIATGSVDELECVFRKVGLTDPSNYSNPGGSGRIQFYWGTSPGARFDGSTPPESSLMGTSAGSSQLNNYDMVMFPCQGHPSTDISDATYANLQSYVNAGGRVFATHWSEGWLNDNSTTSSAATHTSPFQSVATWVSAAQSGGTSSGSGFINTTGFSDGQTIAQWLALVNPGSSLGQIGLLNIFDNVSAVSSAANEWIALNSASGPVMQFSFNTPVGSPAANQCGRVLYNDYHVEAGNGGSYYFPNECANTAMSPQEKLLEYTLFALTNDDNGATLTPTSQAFNPVYVTFTSPTETFTWTNQSVFPVSVTLLNATGDFAVTSSNCNNVPPGGSCQIVVTFTPSAIGTRTGTLTIGAPGSTLTATLTGIGLSPFTVAISSLNFPDTVIGGTASLSYNLTNGASVGFALPTLSVSGDYSYTTNCASTVPGNSSCQINVTFAPTALGPRTGTLTVNASGNPLAVALTGRGLPSFTLLPAALTFANVDAGGGSASQNVTLTSVAPISLPLPAISITGDYSTTTNCPSIVPANTSCTITVTFRPTATGTRTGTLAVQYGAGSLTTAITGNGVDFSIAINPGSASVIAGYNVSTVVTATPIAGFDAAVTLSCSTTAPGSACNVTIPQLILNQVLTAPIDITTTSQYTVVGYTGGMSGGSWLWIFAVGGGLLIWKKRRGAALARAGVLMLFLAAGLTLTGCSGKLPAQNSPYTAPASYTYTLTATDGTITHSATYTLNVSVK